MRSCVKKGCFVINIRYNPIIMGRIEDVEERMRIPLRDKSVSSRQVKQMLENEGIALRGKNTIWQLRGGHTSGRKIDRALLMAEMLKGDAVKKDQLYYKIAKQGVDTRQAGDRRLYTSRGFLDGISYSLNIGIQDIRRSMRAMRVELVDAEKEDALGRVGDTFRAVASEYLAFYSTSRDPSVDIRKVGVNWDGKSIEDFYRSFYTQINRSQTQTTWNSFEVEVMEQFYDQRIFDGSSLSSFDRQTLECNRNRSSLDAHVTDVRARTGIPVDRVVHFAHTNALVYGQSTNPDDLNDYLLSD